VIAAARRRYGASPWHLAAHLAAFAIVAYALSRVIDPRFSRGLNYVVWLVGAAVVHDLLLVPAYSALDAAVRRLPRAMVNHVRFPAAISGAMLLVYWPLILGKGDAAYVRATGRHASGFGARWLAITACAFLGSAIAYGLRVKVSRARARRRPSR
jgi:hypothetical protein